MVGTYYVTVAMETTSADDLLQKMLYLNFVIELRTKNRLFLPNIIDFEAVLVKFCEKSVRGPVFWNTVYVCYAVGDLNLSAKPKHY